MYQRLIWAGLVLGLGGGAAALAGDSGGVAVGKAAPLPECPVMGEPVDFSVSVATDDGPVYLCCKRCARKLNANPAKYAAAVALQRKVLSERARVQVNCPVTTEPIKGDVSIEHDGATVRFCCKRCVKKFASDPTKYAAALANSYSYQTKCPVMGEEIDPEASVTVLGGRKIYFCCKGCDKKLMKNPEKYLPKLAAQGFPFEAKELVRTAAGGHGHDHGGHGHDGHDH